MTVQNSLTCKLRRLSCVVVRRMTTLGRTKTWSARWVVNHRHADDFWHRTDQCRGNSQMWRLLSANLSSVRWGPANEANEWTHEELKWCVCHIPTPTTWRSSSSAHHHQYRHWCVVYSWEDRPHCSMLTLHYISLWWTPLSDRVRRRLLNARSVMAGVTNDIWNINPFSADCNICRMHWPRSMAVSHSP